jgi:type VI secretion system protein ImpB
MAKESLQKKLGRVRPPRVQITYDVQVGDAIEKMDLPFVVGVLADLSGMPDKPLPPIAKRKFVSIDRDNVNDVMKKIQPRLAFKVRNWLSEDNTKLNVELRLQNGAATGQVPAKRNVAQGVRLNRSSGWLLGDKDADTPVVQ